MWDIYHGLDYDDMLPVMQAGTPTICRVRLLSSSHSGDETAYVGRAGEFFGSDSDDVLIVHREDMIIVRGAEMADVFDAILDLLESYNSWEQSLEGMVGDEDGLQKMLDATDFLLNAPAFVYAPDGRAFALSSDYGPTTHWHWAEIIANRGITSNRIRSLRDSIDLPEVWKDSHPRTRRSVVGSHAYMHCSLKPNGYMAGHFVLFGFAGPFRRGLERIVDVLVRAMTRHMEQFYWLYSPTSQLADAFERFFVDDELDEAEVDVFLRALRWAPDDAFRVHVVRERSEKGPVLISKLLSAVTRRFPLVVAFVMDDELVILENESHPEADEPVSMQLPALLGADFEAGISMECVGIWRCRTLYQQAKREVRRCIEADLALSYADDHSYECMRERYRDDDLLFSYVHPELVRLARYDETNDTNFYETLRAYAFSNFHMSDAARYLGMHRNSLDYRLKRIREVIDFSTFDALAVSPDEEKFRYVLMSFVVIDAHSDTW